MTRHFRSLLLFCALVAFANGLPEVKQLIEPDELDSKYYQPYTVALKFKNHYKCSGAIISPTKILTAAICVMRCLSEADSKPIECENLMSVYAGSTSLSSGGNTYRIKTVKVPDAEAIVKRFANDIAVITLTTPIKFSDTEKPIELPDKDIADDSTAVTSGWGVKTINGKLNDNLQNFKRQIFTAATCNVVYKDNHVQVEADGFCGTKTADNPGFCQGDSGSPLIQDGKVIGIASWGIGCSHEKPDGYTNVYKYLEFIKKELE